MTARDDLVGLYRDGDIVTPTPAERRAMRHEIHMLDPEIVWGRFGWWYRFWLRVLTGTRFRRVQ